MAAETVLAGLRRRWRLGTVIGGVTIASLAAVAALGYRASASLVWATTAMGVWLYQSGYVTRRLALNRRPDETTLLDELGPGTNMTIVRGWLLACLAGFLLVPRPAGLSAWAPALIYALADVADYLDGYLARVSGYATLLGEALDIEFDALGLLVAVSLAVHYSVLPVSYLPVGLARYAFIFGLWARKRARKPVQSLPPSESRRPLAGLQMGALSVILIPLLQPPVTTLGGLLLAVPLLIGFARDWLVVTGALNPASDGYQRIRARLRLVLLYWLPVPLRLALIAMVVQLGIFSASGVEVAGAGLSRLDPLTLGTFFSVARLIELSAAGAVTLGFAPRLSAIVLLAMLILRAMGGAASPALLAALSGAVAILMVGSGAFSIWQPEVKWFRRRAGETREASET